MYPTSMSENPRENLIDQLKIVLKDALDYLNSFITLQQARFTVFTLSGVIFIIQISFACLLGLTAFILVNVALGMGLNLLLKNPFLTLLILGLIYAVLAWIISRKALRWLSNLKS